MQREYYSQHDARAGKISESFPFVNIVLGVYMSGASFSSLKKICPILSIFLLGAIVGSLITQIATLPVPVKSTHYSTSAFSFPSPIVGEAK